MVHGKKNKLIQHSVTEHIRFVAKNDKEHAINVKEGGTDSKQMWMCFRSRCCCLFVVFVFLLLLLLLLLFLLLMFVGVALTVVVETVDVSPELTDVVSVKLPLLLV